MRKGWLIAGVLAFVVVGVGFGGALSYGSDDRLPDEYAIGGLALGGLTVEAAIKQVRDRVAEIEAATVTLKLDKKDSDTALAAPSLSFKRLGLSVDAEETIRALERYRDYSWWERAKMRYHGEKPAAYDPQIVWDDNRFRETAAQAWSSLVIGQTKDAARTINERDEVLYAAESIGRELDIAALLDEVKKQAPTSLAAAPVAQNALALGATVIETLPEITTASLKEEGIERKIAEFKTSFTTSGEGRSHNVTAAAMALNETLLMPDEVFEYGKIVAKAEKEYGYKEAPVIMNGKLTPGIGGGICQVSSTLYNAILLAGLEVVERRNHSLPVSYLPVGLDATFASGYVNFKFRNSTGKQLLIRTVVEGKTVTVKLFGTMPENVAYRTETVQVKVNSPKTVYVANAKLAPGKQDTIQKGAVGYVVESYLLKLVDGTLVERKKLARDTYRTQDTLIAVHPDDPRLKPAEGAPAPAQTPASGEVDGPVEPV